MALRFPLFVLIFTSNLKFFQFLFIFVDDETDKVKCMPSFFQVGELDVYKLLGYRSKMSTRRSIWTLDASLTKWVESTLIRRYPGQPIAGWRHQCTILGWIIQINVFGRCQRDKFVADLWLLCCALYCILSKMFFFLEKLWPFLMVIKSYSCHSDWAFFVRRC